MSLLTTLRDHFGFPAFRQGQQEAIQHLLVGRHTLVVMPTGAGKSLIYQLAAFHVPGVTLVISPLVSLMKDQVDSLARRGIPGTYINSLLTIPEQDRRLGQLVQGKYRLVYIAPERLRHTTFLTALSRVKVGLLAVDEAHCISQWGHDFRPDYLHIATARLRLGQPVTAALTATATPTVQGDIVRLLGLDNAARIVTGFNRPNLTFEVQSTPDTPDKLRALRQLLTEMEGGAAIVYVGTRRDAEEVAEFARTVVGVDAAHYHGGLDAQTRIQLQNRFMAGDLNVVAATTAFGMGIDRPDVRLVVNYGLPDTLETYYQAAGRGGRDGEPARAVLLYAPRDRALPENFIENMAVTMDEARALYRALVRYRRPEVWVTTDDLSLVTALSEVKIKVGLAHLEQTGALERLGDDGAHMLLRVDAWNEKALRDADARLQVERRHRQAQLAQMVAYAEANDCRRQRLMRYFGDTASPTASRCCDNCLASQPNLPNQPNDVRSLSQAERAALIVLDALRRMRWEVGREKLALVLKGSRARDIQQPAYTQNTYYGRLAVFKLAEIEGMISQLIQQGYLKQVGADRPVLQVTPKGETALRQRAAIALHRPQSLAAPSSTPRPARQTPGETVNETGRLFQQGLTPAKIANRRGLTLGTIYGHLADLIKMGRVEVVQVLSEEVVQQVCAAIEAVGDVSRLTPIKELLPTEITYAEIRCVVEAWRRQHDEPQAAPPSSPPPVHQAKPHPAPGQPATQDDIEQFLARPHARSLSGPWRVGWALDFHSRFSGADWGRSEVGGLAYRLKYEGDATALTPLVERIFALIQEHPELAEIDAILAVPPSSPRAFDPVAALATGLSQRLRLPTWPGLIKTRPTAPQKELRSLAQKRANVAGAFAARGPVRGRRVLVVDDLYDSGATLTEVTQVLLKAGAAQVCVLTLTRTIHADA